jgi:epoxide hydrolase-like predicted phosphatase
MIKTVIFDFGGVLVRTEDPEPRRILAEKLGMTYDELANLVYGTKTSARASIGEITAEEHKSAVMKSLGLPHDSFQEFGDEFWRGDFLDAHLVQFISGLKGHYTIALLSNAWDDLRPLLTSLWDIENLFDHIFISAEMGLAKPDPAIYQEVSKRLNQDPSELIFVDDFIENILAARESGWNAIHFQSPEGALAELAEYLDLDL